MKKTFTFILSLFCFNIYSQQSISINPNECYARMHSSGEIFDGNLDDLIKGNGHGFIHPYHFNNNSPQNDTRFFTWLNVSGKRQDDSIRAKLGDHRHSNNLFPGPILKNSNRPVDNAHLYDYVWKINGENVLAHISDFQDDGNIDRVVSPELFQWPALGNPHFESIFGFQLPIDQSLAPFHDADGDNLYNPLNGDYPVYDERFPNIIPNEFTFVVANDYNISGGMGFEYHIMSCGFSCDNFPALNRTIFTRYILINRSGYDYNHLRIGHHTEGDLGHPKNDYVGVDTNLNTTYFYNAEEFDEWPIGQFFRPGILSMTYLNQGLYNSAPMKIYYVLDDPKDFYLAQNGIFLRYSSYGQINYDTIFMAYPDYPNDTNGISMINQNGNYGHDFRTITATDTFSLNNGQSAELNVAWHHFRDTNIYWLNQSSELKTIIPKIQGFFDAGYNGGISSNIPDCIQLLDTACMSDCVWPGDANSDGQVDLVDYLVFEYFNNYSEFGEKRLSESIDWLPFPAADWNRTIDQGNLNAKHADCNGDGLIDHLDLEIIKDNHLLTRFGSQPKTPIKATESDIGLKLDFGGSTIDLSEPRRLRIFFLGATKLKLIGLENKKIQGYTFRIVLDTNYFYPMIDAEYNMEKLSKNNFITSQIENQSFQYAIITDSIGKQINSSLFYLTPFRFIARDDIFFPPGVDSLPIPFPLYDIKAIDVEGNLFDLDMVPDSLFVLAKKVGTVEKENKSKIIIFPNPTTSDINIQSNSQKKIKEVLLMDSKGKLIRSQYMDIPVSEVQWTELVDGLYFVNIKLDSGETISEKIIVLK